MKRSWLSRKTPLARKTPINPVNRERKKRRADEGEVYGPYHRAMAKLPCSLAGYPPHVCVGIVCGHHLTRVGNGGIDRANEVPVCVRAHRECHTRGDRWVEYRYGVDLRRLAERLAETIDP